MRMSHHFSTQVPYRDGGLVVLVLRRVGASERIGESRPRAFGGSAGSSTVAAAVSAGCVDCASAVAVVSTASIAAGADVFPVGGAAGFCALVLSSQSSVSLLGFA